jgi:hypothetical protein
VRNFARLTNSAQFPLERHRIAVNAIKTTLRDQPPSQQLFGFVGRQRRTVAVITPGFNQRIAQLPTRFDQERRRPDGQIADFEIEDSFRRRMFA